MAAMKKGRAEPPLTWVLEYSWVLDRTHRPRGQRELKPYDSIENSSPALSKRRGTGCETVWSVQEDRDKRSVCVIFTSKSGYETETIQSGKILKHLRVKNDTLITPPKHWMQKYVWWHRVSRSFQQPTQKWSSRDGVITACFSTWWDMGTHSRTRKKCE